MTVNELLKKLEELSDNNKGNYEVQFGIDWTDGVDIEKVRVENGEQVVYLQPERR